MKQPLNIPIGERLYELHEGWCYQWFDELGREWRRICIPAGYRYDGASVPRKAWTLSGLTPDGLLRGAAVIHDFIYDHRGNMPEGSCHWGLGDKWQPAPDIVFTRKDADQLFLQILRESGVKKRQCLMAYAAVRLFGGGFWNS